MKKLVMLVSVGALLLIALVGFQKKDSSFYLSLTPADSTNDSTSVYFKHQIVSLPEWQTLYDSLHLREAGLSLEGFRFAWNGFQKAKFEKPVLAIADFSQSSCQKRLYVIDIKARKLIYNTYVAHGRNSGEEYARKFSNQNSSYQSSLGFYRALTTYQGKHGLSLRLQGLEENINHHAYERAIVMHGADYVSEEFIRRTGRLGRSQGCPAVSVADTPKLISLLSNGAGLFLYYPDIAYLKKSKMIGMFKNDS